MPDQPAAFGALLRQTREAAGLTRAALGERAGLDMSHIYRMEVGARRPSRESALALADALDVRGEPLNLWLAAAGYTPVPLLGTVRGAVRTRGSARRPAARTSRGFELNASAWKRLEELGLDEDRLARLLRAAQSAGPTDPHRIARLISSALARLTATIECPVRVAVIPAAGGQHRLLAPHLIQRLLLRAVREVVEAGVTNVVVVVSPDMIDTIYTPLKDALDLSIAPAVTLSCRTQAIPNGLGDAILAAESDIGNDPFVVLLPDDVLDEQRGRRRPELPAMMRAFTQVRRSHVIAVTSAPKSRMAKGGVAALGSTEVAPNVFPVHDMVEKPELDHAVYRKRAFRIVGRYILQPTIFKPLRRLRTKSTGRVELTTALAELRAEGHDVYAFEIEAIGRDLGQFLEHADAILGDSHR